MIKIVVRMRVCACTHKRPIFIGEKQFYDFVVWTTKDLILERIYMDVRFTEKLSRKLTLLTTNININSLLHYQGPCIYGRSL